MSKNSDPKIPSVSPASSPDQAHPTTAEAPSPLPSMWIDVLLVLVVAVLPNIYYAIEYRLLPKDLRDVGYPYPFDSLRDLAVSVGLIFLVLYCIRARRSRWSDFGFSTPRLSDLVWFILLAFADVVITLTIWWLWDTPVPKTNLPVSLLTPQWLIPGVTTGVLALGEEIIFRSYLFVRITQLTGKLWLGLAAPTILFALGHMDRPLDAFLSILLTGLLYAVFFAATRRLWPVFLAHFAYNLAVQTMWSAT